MSKLHVVTGGPGAGKSTLLRHLRSYPFGSVEFDELPEDDGSLLGVDIISPSATSVRPAYNRLWVKIATMMVRTGKPVLILCPLTPSEWASAAAIAVDPPRVAWARLDCADVDRRARLDARGWEPDRIEEAIKDAEGLRWLVDREFNTTARSPADVAASLAAWVTSDHDQHFV